MHLMNCGYFDYMKNPKITQFEGHAGIKMVQAQGSLALVYLSVDTILKLSGNMTARMVVKKRPSPNLTPPSLHFLNINSQSHK